MISFLDLGFSIPFSSQSQLGVGKRKRPDTAKDFWKASGQNFRSLKVRLPLQPSQTERVPCKTEATCYGGGWWVVGGGPRDRICVSYIAGRFFTTEPLGKPKLRWLIKINWKWWNNNSHGLYLHSACCMPYRASLVAQLVKNLLAMQETWVQSLGWEDLLEKGTATPSSIVAWRIPGTE